MAGAFTAFTPSEVLAALPQQEPFRFVDDIAELDDDHIVATYRFRPEADFYRGHFPGNPVTPGVILVEAMAQVGVVALGIYLLSREVPPPEVSKVVTMFTDMQIDFTGVVRPGDQVVISGRKLFFRRRKLRSAVEMHLADGSPVCAGTVAGMGVPR